MPVDKKLLQRFRSIFRGNPEHWGQYTLPKDLDDKGKGRFVHRTITDNDFENHLTGKADGIGLVPIKDNRGTLFFGAIDWDDKKADHEELAKRVAQWGMPLVVCRSRRGGAHLFCLTTEEVSADVMRAKLQYFVSLLGIKNPPPAPGKKPQPVEIFPKQGASEWRQLIKKGEDPNGNWINIPYYKGNKSNRYGFDDEGNKLSLEEFLNFAEKKRITEAMLKAWVPQVGQVLGEGAPPCLEIIHTKGTDAGEKGNSYLFNLGVFYKLAYPDSWEDKLREYNETLDDPMEDSDLRSTIRSIDRKDYAYSCENYPINDFCNKALCRTRKFGVGNFGNPVPGTVNLATLPPTENLTKHNTVPPYYTVTVFGQRITMTDEEWLTFKLFQKKVYNATLLVYPSMSQNAWLTTINTLFPPESVTVEEAPAEASASGKLKIFLVEFLSLHSKAEGREALLKGLPWLETTSGKIYFRQQDFERFLTSEKNFRDFSKGGKQPELWLYLKAFGVNTKDQLRINKDLRPRVWSAPLSMIEHKKPEKIEIVVEDEPTF